MFDEIQSRRVATSITIFRENPPMISATSGPVEARYHSDNLSPVLSEYTAGQGTRHLMPQ